MPLIEFNESLVLGIPEIDEQHKYFISLANRLCKELQEREISYYESLKFIDELFDYARNHFSLEEYYFHKFGDNDFIEHIREHHDFNLKTAKLRLQYKKNPSNFPYEILNFMVEWFIDHIKNFDMKYRDLFRKKGME